MPPRKRSAMTKEHKAALAQGREQGAAVRRYLAALEHSKTGRGRRPSTDNLHKQLETIEADLETAEPLRRLNLLQQRRDLQAKLAQPAASKDISELEAGFVAAAAEYGNRKGIGYSTWRDVGVPAEVLRRAGVPRARRA